MQYYGSSVAVKICKITARKLNYWVTSGVISPSDILETNDRRKTYYLFTFDDLVRLQLVKSLRDAGITLASIKRAVKELTKLDGPAWKQSRLITDGKKLYRVTDDPNAFESLAKSEPGQLVMSVVALDQAQELVTRKLRRHKPLNTSRYGGKIRKYRAG